ncbi:MAG: hypothetical protein H6626_14135 [Pseudobdellovibrionaceae bacterium]|nr:hypothetical protein [Bdellovibrionales bacterium]USN47309.1 MAG: hypothetical protein H6626_14135 [Pseudobdellovibrionaceae bacterium]
MFKKLTFLITLSLFYSNTYGAETNACSHGFIEIRVTLKEGEIIDKNVDECPSIDPDIESIAVAHPGEVNLDMDTVLRDIETSEKKSSPSNRAPSDLSLLRESTGRDLKTRAIEAIFGDARDIDIDASFGRARCLEPCKLDENELAMLQDRMGPTLQLDIIVPLK